MIIAYLVNQYPQTSQSFIRREIAALEASGVQVLRFTLRRFNGPLADPADEAERRKTRVVLEVGVLGLLWALLRETFTRPLPLFQALKKAIAAGRIAERGLVVHGIYLAEACVLRQWLAEAGVSHVHSHFGTNSTTVAMLCRILGGPPYSFTTHGPEEFDSPRSLGLGEKVGLAKFAVVVSNFGRSQLYRWCKLTDWPKIEVIRCGVDATFLEPHGVPVPQAGRLVCVGRLAEQKGQFLLVEAAALLAEEGMDFELTLVGDGPLRAPIERLIADKGLEGRVRLAGWMSGAKVRDEILQSRAMVLPSFAEGLPVVLMESLALGRPVVSTYVAGIPELVEAGRSGWLVPAGSVEALALAMREALQTPPEILEQMGQAGRDRVLCNHDAAVESAKLAALFTPTINHSATPATAVLAASA